MTVLVEDVGSWWCCLNPIERNMSTALAVAFAIGLGYITEEDYNALWALAGFAPDNVRVATYEWAFSLTHTTITDIEGNVTAIVQFGFLRWSSISVYIVENGASCSERCKLLRFSEP